MKTPETIETSATLINNELVKDRGISSEDVLKIERLHADLNDVVSFPEKYEDPVSYICDIELKLQKLWGFEESTDYHTHWLRISGCTCPKKDNYDRLGLPLRVYSANCPWHSIN